MPTIGPLPDVYPSIQDGNLGVSPNAGGISFLKVGLAPKGAINSIFTVGQGDTTTLQNLLGPGGGLVEASALALQVGGPLYLVTANPSTYGTAGSVTKGVTLGSSALAISIKPFQSVIAKIALGGIRGTATVQFSVDGGSTYGAAVVTAATVVIAQAPYITLAFTTGTYVAGDSWSISTSGTSVFTGSGVDGVTFSSASSVDSYSLLVVCTGSGALGAATFKYSLDNGNTYSGSILVPGSGLYAIPSTGVFLTFTNALFATEAWSCTIAGPSYTTSDLTAALNSTVLATLRQFGVDTGIIHVVGTPSTVSAAATLDATVQTLLDGAATGFQYIRGLIEVPADTDANTASAFAAVGTLRVGACAGFAYQISPLSGRQALVSSAWPVTARLASGMAPSDDLGFVGPGPLSGTSLTASNTALPGQRDEAATPALDAARFITLRTIVGLQGVFVTNGRLMAPSGSDYTFLQYGLIIDVTAAATRRALIRYLNAKVRVNPPPTRPGQPAAGTLFAGDAASMSNWVTARLKEAVVDTQDALAVQAAPSLTANVLSTQTVPWVVGVLPYGYSKFIPVQVGFLPVTAA